MKEMKIRLQELIKEFQAKEDITANGGGYIILATAPKDEEQEELICAVQGKHHDLVEMLVAALRGDPSLKRLILDAMMLDIVTSGLSDRLDRLKQKDKEGCDCGEGCACDNAEPIDCTCTEGCGPGTCEE